MKRTVFIVILTSLLLTISFLILRSQNNIDALSLDASANLLWETKGVYISPNGNDGNPCTAAEPCSTLNMALSVAKPGDAIHFMEGRYPDILTISNSGTARNYVVIVGQNAIFPGVVISGNYVIVSGVDVAGSASHGILVNGKHIIVEDSTIRHSVTENGSGTCHGSGSWGSALKVMVGGEDVILRRNLVYENCGEGIAVTRGINVLLENNIVRDNFSVNIYIDNSSYVTVKNNKVSCTGIYLRDQNRPAGIAVAEEFYEGWGAQRHDNKIFGNQISNCQSGISSWESELPAGREVRLLIEGNFVTGTIGNRPIALLTHNEGVVVRNNQTDKPIKVDFSEGVILEGNTLVESVP